MLVHIGVTFSHAFPVFYATFVDPCVCMIQDSHVVEDDVDEAVAKSPTMQVVESFHRNLGTTTLVHLVESLRRLSGKTITIGTGFSGSGVLMQWAHALCLYWKQTYNITVTVEELYQCDIDGDVQDFCQVEWPEVGLTFRRVEDLVCPRAYDCRSGSFQRVPFTDIFVGGFVCKFKSGFNSRRGVGGANCCQTGEGSTGLSYTAVMSFIRKVKPRVVILENVKNLSLKASNSDQSDKDFILNELRGAGYAARDFLTDARTVGSLQKRTRWYLIGYYQSLPKLERCRQLMPQISAPLVDLYTLLEIDSLADLPGLHSDLLGQDMQPRISKKKDCAFRDQHLELYTACNIEYPPDLTLYPQEFQDFCANLSERQAEVMIYAEDAEPYAKEGVVQYTDLNLSIQYHVGKDLKGSVFSGEIPTLATSTVLCARAQLSPGKRCWRLIRGAYLMKVIGFFELKGNHAPVLLQRLVGNAFSGFVAGSVMMAVLHGLGQP
jgi:hypothetical protein